MRQLISNSVGLPASLRAMKLDQPLADDYAAGVGDGEHGKPRNDMEEFKRRSRIAGRQRWRNA